MARLFMQNKNKNIIKAREWFAIGEREFNFAKLNLDDKQNNFYSEMCFMFHQAVEKFLKGYLASIDIEPPKIHDNGSLCMLCAKHNKSFLKYVDDCSKLNKFYISTRYPVHYEIMLKSDAKEAFKIAKNIIGLIGK